MHSSTSYPAETRLTVYRRLQVLVNRGVGIWDCEKSAQSFWVSDFSTKIDHQRKNSGEFQPKRICQSKMRLAGSWSCWMSKNRKFWRKSKVEEIHSQHFLITLGYSWMLFRSPKYILKVSRLSFLWFSRTDLRFHFQFRILHSSTSYPAETRLTVYRRLQVHTFVRFLRKSFLQAGQLARQSSVLAFKLAAEASTTSSTS